MDTLHIVRARDLDPHVGKTIMYQGIVGGLSDVSRNKITGKVTLFVRGTVLKVSGTARVTVG